jgi:hypothetical protein
LQTALNHPASVQPGATIYLRGGTYAGKFSSQLDGTAANPITVRSYPGEWAKIEGYVTSTLGATINASTTTVTLANAAKFNVGQVFTFHDQTSESAEELVYIHNKNGNTLTIIRGWGGTTLRQHNAGALCVLGGSQLTINGSHTIYREFEVTNSDPARTWDVVNTQNAPHIRGACVFQTGPRNKLLNLLLHDCENGLFTAAAAANSEVYGNVVYNNGYNHAGGIAGHGLYVQSNAPTFRIADNIVFNNFNFGIKAVSQTGNSIGFLIENNAAFNNGSVPFQTEVRNAGILVGATNGLSDQNSLIGNFLYQPPGTGGGALKVGYAADNGAVVVSNNYIMGNSTPLELNRWQQITGSGNKIFISASIPAWSNRTLTEDHPLSGRTIAWNNNAYYNTSGASNSFTHNNVAYNFANWKQLLGVDANSTYATSLPPSTVLVKPNQYQPGRANIIVYNWTRAGTVSANLAGLGLANGQSFTIVNAQNYPNGLALPVFSGLFNAANPTITLDLGSSATRATTTPVGYSFTPTSTAPEFAVFIVLPL